MMAALSIGAVINVILLLIFGGMTVYKFITPKEVELQAPPPLKPIEPPTIKYNQKKTKDRQDKSQRPKQKQIKARALDNIVTPQVDIKIAEIAPSVDVSPGAGDTFGSGRGLGGGGLRMGVSAVDFFGIKNKGERIVIILDIARSMLDPRRGDIPGYAEVKSRVNDVIQSLNSATLFNVMVFSNGLDVMSSSLVLANAENKQRAASFIDPYWKADGGRFVPGYKEKTFLNNYQPTFEGIIPKSGSSRMDMALLASFEQGADAIFMLTDGTPSVTRELNDKEQKEYDKKLAQYEKRKASVTPEELAEYQKQKAKAAEAAKKNRAANEARKAADAKKRAAKGLDAVVREGKTKSNNKKPNIKSPFGSKPKNSVDIKEGKEFVQWMEDLAKAEYGSGRKQLPTVNIIGYSIPENGKIADFLNDLRRQFPGSQMDVFGKYIEENNT